MKKSILYFLTAIMLFAVSCSESYDDSALVGRVDNLENRVAKLEELCKQMNTNISSLQSLVTALQNNDYVTGVTPITKNGETIGYTITFTKSQPITIYHGEDGKDGQNGTDGKDGVNGTDGQDGHTPIIGVKQDTDGIYYWTLDGDWLLDDAGNKIKAQGTDGKDGAEGKDGQDGVDGKDGVDGTDGKDGENGTDGKDGITPQLKIENDYWYISYDNGKTWTQLGKATGEDGQDGVNGTNGTNGIDGVDGDSFFQGVDTSNDDYVIFTLADGTELVLPRHKNLSISFDIANGAACMPSASIKVGYKLTGADSGTTIETIGDGGWKSVVTRADVSSGYITITAPESGGDGKVVMFATTSNGFTAMKAICFEEGIVSGVNDAYQVGYEESTLKITLKTNLTYFVSIPNDAKSWISVADTRATMRSETLTFTILENPEDNPARSATIKLIGECGDILQNFVIMQDYQPSSNPIVFADANVKKVCVEKYDTNGDGELSEKEAAAVTKIESNFFGDYASMVTSFDEFKYFKKVAEIPWRAFYQCAALTSIQLPYNVKQIGVAGFSECDKLNVINIPDDVTEIGEYCFRGCSNLRDIQLPRNLCLIGNEVFHGCVNLSEIVIPDKVSKVGHGAFGFCEKLKKITIPNGVTYIGSSAFSDCTNLTDIIISDSVISIESHAFSRCSNLANVVLGTNLQYLGDRVFEDCKTLVGIYIPESVINFGESIFSGCSNLQHIDSKYASDDNKCLIIDGVLNSFAPSGILSYKIPERVSAIGPLVFYRNEDLKEITIPNTITFIDEYSLYFDRSDVDIYCEKLTPPTMKSVLCNNVIYVPNAAINAYKVADGWKDYADKIVGYTFNN